MRFQNRGMWAISMVVASVVFAAMPSASFATTSSLTYGNQYVVVTTNSTVGAYGSFALDGTWASFLDSQNGSYHFRLQGDGNAVIYRGGTAIWSSRTSGQSLRYVFQLDGNMVIYGSNNHVYWQSQTNDNTVNSCYRLIMQNDGNLVDYKSHYDTVNEECAASATAIWSSAT